MPFAPFASKPPLAMACCLAVVAAAAAPATAEDQVGVLITGPLSATVGERLSFEVELVNRTGKPLSQLRIIDYFDEGLTHEASKSPIEQKGTVELAAGTSRRLTLEFTAAAAGRQCHRVEILDPSHTFVGGATACVEVQAEAAATPRAATPPSAAAPPTTPPAVTTPPVAAPTTPPPAAAPDLLQPAPPLATPSGPEGGSRFSAATDPPATPSLEMEISGPTRRQVGEVAEYVATVRNIGSVASTSGMLELAWDNGLAAAEASDGYKLGERSVSWQLPAIEPGGKARRQINLRVIEAGNASVGFRESVSRRCVRGVLSGVVGGVLVADEACVLVESPRPRLRTPSEAGLRLSLADCDDPIRVGSTTTVVCTITNGGAEASGPLRVMVTIPEQAQLVGDPVPSRVRIDGRTVTFDGLDSLESGGSMTLELAFRIPAAGAWRSEAVLAGDTINGTLEAGCETTALSP